MERFFSDQPYKGKHFTAISPDMPSIRIKPINGIYFCQYDQGDYFLKVYIRQVSKTCYILYAHMPQLEYLNELGKNKLKLIKFLGMDKVLALVYKNSVSPQKESGLPAFEFIDDFCTSEKGRKVWVLRECLQGTFSTDVIMYKSKENEIYTAALNEMISICDVFDQVHENMLKDFRCDDWVMKCGPKKAKVSIDNYQKNDIGPEFLLNMKDSPEAQKDERVIQLKQNGMVLFSKNEIYTYRDKIKKKDYDEPMTLWIKADVFTPALKDSGILYQVFLIPTGQQHGTWHIGINLGSIKELGSFFFNDIDSKASAEIKKTAYEHMKKSAKIWFYSNDENRDIPLSDYVYNKTRKISYNCNEGSDMVVTEDNFLTYRYRYTFYNINAIELWNKMHLVSRLLDDGLQISNEIIAYIPIYKRKCYTLTAEKILEAATFGMAPISTTKKIIKMLNGEYKFNFNG